MIVVAEMARGICNKRGKVVVVMPAYNCARTLARTYHEIPMDVVDDVVLVDDCSSDATCLVAKELGIRHIFRHIENTGYGGNQKTCYDVALSLNASTVIMLHPDYQYDPKLIPEMLTRAGSGADVVLASRFTRGFEALRLGMPAYKFFANRFLTSFQNALLHVRLSEYHTGYRLFSREVLESIGYRSFSDDFIFDNEMLVAIVKRKYKIQEVYCPARYQKDSSSIGFFSSVKYGLSVLVETLKAM